MHGFGGRIEEGLLMAAGMFWQTGWSLVFGFTISALLQAVAPADQIRRLLGRAGPKEIAIATAAGAASSSCSYASAAITRTLFKKGAALTPSLAFLFSSTNLVLELGLILLLLMGWQFMAGEWIGGIVLVVIMSVLVRLTYPKRLVEAARQHPEQSGGHEHHSMPAQGATWQARLVNPQTRILVAQNFSMDWSMLWKDLLAGFLIGGFIAAFVPDAFWKSVFLTGQPAWIRIPFDVVVGPLIAVVTFVCSIGNVPLAAVLWASGASFGGVLAFLYADLIVLPLLDTYRRFFGWKMAAYIGGIFYATMVLAALIMTLAFHGLGIVPPRDANIRHELTHFSLNYTFWLNLVFGALALSLFWVNRRHPMSHDHHHGHDHHAGHDHSRHAHGADPHAGHDHAHHGHAH